MKKIVIFLFLFLSTAIAQDTTTIKYDPCNDPLLLKLAHKDTLTDNEMNTYVALRRLCDESKTRNEVSETLKQNQETFQSSMTAYYVIAAIGLIASLIFLVAQ